MLVVRWPSAILTPQKKTSENKSLSVHLNFSVACSRHFVFVSVFSRFSLSRCRYRRPPDTQDIRNLSRTQPHTLPTSRRCLTFWFFVLLKVCQLLTARQTLSTHHPDAKRKESDLDKLYAHDITFYVKYKLFFRFFSTLFTFKLLPY